MKRNIFLVILLLLIDQISKIIITKFYLNISFDLIPGILGFLPKQNIHGSYLFSLLNYKSPLLLQIILLFFSFYIIIFLSKYLIYFMNSKFLSFSLIFVFAGSIASAFDTIFWGGSWDFIYLYNLFIFDFKDKKIFLMGISEGATIAPIVAKKIPNEIDALLLMSFSYENLKATLEWQLSGESSMVNMRKWFDYDKKGYITKKDFNLDKFNIRKIILKDIEFEDLDINKDGILTSDDYRIMLKDYKDQLLYAIENEDDIWLKENYEVYLTSKWFKEHFSLPPISEILKYINIPIYIFQGKEDANIPIRGIEKIKKDFLEYGKKNLKTYVFDGHDHDLNYLLYPMQGIISGGLKKVFNVAEELLI